MGALNCKQMLKEEALARPLRRMINYTSASLTYVLVVVGQRLGHTQGELRWAKQTDGRVLRPADTEGCTHEHKHYD